MNKVVQRFFFQRITFCPFFVCGRTRYISLHRIGISGIVPPTALKDYSTVVGRIFDSSCLINHPHLTIAIENLAGHNPYSLFSSVSSGNATDSYIITIHGSNRSRHMRAVTGIFGSLPTDIPVIFHEIVTITVTLITIAVIILVRTNLFLFIHPHISRQIFMSIHNSFIKHGNNDFRITRTQFPCFLTINVGANNSRSLLCCKVIRSTVNVSPLVR